MFVSVQLVFIIQSEDQVLVKGKINVWDFSFYLSLYDNSREMSPENDSKEIAKKVMKKKKLDQTFMPNVCVVPYTHFYVQSLWLPAFLIWNFTVYINSIVIHNIQAPNWF